MSGEADIEDYDRLRSFLGNYENLCVAVAHMKMASEEYAIMLATTGAEFEAAIGSERNEIGKRLKAMRDPKEVAKLISNGNNDNMLGLKELLGEFRQGVFEIVVAPENTGYAFRSVLDTQWLRVSPERLRALYGGHSSFDVTILGQVTYLPKKKVDAELASPPDVSNNDTRGSENLPEQEISSQVEASEEAVGTDVEEGLEGASQEQELRFAGSMRTLVNTLSVMEKGFLQSEGVTDVIMRPLAIYRETKIAN